MTLKKKILSAKSLNQSKVNSTPSTVIRAAITAEIKMTRGKQLVEHNPFTLIPDPQNPRPGELINEEWLKNNLKLGTNYSLCQLKDDGFYIPYLDELKGDFLVEEEESYKFLRELALSIRNEGLIEPIEIFLADKKNDPEYFFGSSKEYGYVILEGHQRRLAAMMAGVDTVTCIEITDETMLAKLKVKHRKLRRQLSENNLRKGLTVSQNFKVVYELFRESEIYDIKVKELSAIIGLNEEIAGALKKLCVNKDKYPEELYLLIEENSVSFSWLRKWVGKPIKSILKEIDLIKNGNKKSTVENSPKVKPRGKSGGAKKKSATFKINSEKETTLFTEFLKERIPEISGLTESNSVFSNLEELLKRILNLAVDEKSDLDRI